MIKDGYVHVLSSDAHSIEKRPPHLKLAYEVLEKGAGRKTSELMKRNAERVFRGEDILY